MCVVTRTYDTDRNIDQVKQVISMDTDTYILYGCLLAANEMCAFLFSFCHNFLLVQFADTCC